MIVIGASISSHLCAEALRCASTGKERDKESNYDYFGGRYYDARIGRWGGVEPQLSQSPFQFARLNPLAYIYLLI